MSPSTNAPRKVSRRDVLGGAASLIATSAMGAGVAGMALADDAKQQETPPLPWPWVELDPMEAGTRAYRYYMDKGGCGSASYLSLLSLLKEKVGFPWTTMPDMLMVHAAAGFGGHGTLCGALAGASVIINMVTYGEKRDSYLQNSAIVDRLFWWYAEQEFPTRMFDHLSPIPDQIRVKAMTPLCHSSVSKWSLAAGVKDLHDPAKLERCAKVAGEVVFMTAQALNEFFEGKWVAPTWKPSESTQHCIGCHGPATPGKKPMNWNQQGHMDCLACHDDHTSK
ncbi:C-GCAxxG-C-C family protein [Ferrimonas balearica]|uniref:C-GCAxxG-C-C family protein n=1 Tax=Ferrimonas balearica TaxID=44012 RepID=UPI001C98BE37|nr:C-GCAxxG-C-C family protein [Ferrimonas balearica]MBY6107079.1 C-GCAxxG-C-C family protein [Ferrimonas balearica]